MTSVDNASASDLDLLLDRLQCLRGRPRRIDELSGGLTNRNLRVRTAERDVVVRISSEGGPLAIDRDVEHANSLAAAEAGASPQVVEYVRDPHLLVVDYIDGRTLTELDVADPVMLGRIADVCRALHAGPRFVSDYDMFSIQRSYLSTVQAR
jgi:hypothetical protein